MTLGKVGSTSTGLFRRLVQLAGLSPETQWGTVRVACFLLVTLTLGCYWELPRNGFINYDDPEYITQNPQVRAGLTWQGVAWAFSTGHASNWHPLTWISHMLDYELYGLNPAGHHLTNLLFHIANTLLLFLFLHRITRALWRSAFVAALFALHPLHVESVAWISERKDVLSTFFFLLTLLAYVRYVNASNANSELQASSPRRKFSVFNFPFSILSSSACYLISLALFALGLMSKPMVVTLPCVLLLLDYWPLRRFEISNLKCQVSDIALLLREKIPFFLLASVGCIVTVLVQRAGGAVSALDRVPLSARVSNATIAYVQYLSNTFWPKDLAVLYPYQKHWPILSVLGAAVVLALISVLCAVSAKRRSYLLVGWLWFLGTLIPVIGLVQVGAQSMADRYMYIPSIGLFVIAAWGVADLSVQLQCRRSLPGCLAIAAGAACIACTGVQLSYWHDSVSLFKHTVDVTEGNHIAWNNLGNAFNDAGEREKALSCYTQSIRLKPNYAEGEYNLGTAYLELVRFGEAISHLRSATQIDPTSSRAFNNLGRAWLAAGHQEEGLRCFVRAVQLTPDWAEAHYNLGTCLLAASPAEGLAELSKSVALDASNSAAQMNLGVGLAQQGRTDEALPHFAKAVGLAPNDPEAHFNYGLGLLDHGRPGEASVQFSEELRLRPNEAKAHYRMAVALVRLNKPQEAALHYRETLRLAPEFTQAREELASLDLSY